MPAIFRFFWFLCAAFMAINIVIWLQGLATGDCRLARLLLARKSPRR